MKCRGVMLGAKALAMVIGGCERRVQGPAGMLLDTARKRGGLWMGMARMEAYFVRCCWFWIFRTDMADWRIPHPTRGTSLLPNSSTA